MTDIEAALRDALSARATAVLPDPQAYDEVLRRRGRRRMTRWAAPLGALAATAAVIGLLVVAGRPARDARPARTAATRVVALQYHSLPGRKDILARAVVLDTGALSGAPLVATAAADGDVTAVAAVGDGKTFYAASHVASCHTVILRITTSGVRVVTHVDAAVLSLAASRDGRLLAYTVDRPTGTCRQGTRLDEIRLRDLKRGTERTWARTGDPQGVSPLAWSPDGRTIAYAGDGGIATLDTTKPGSTLPRGVRGPCSASLPRYLPTGEIAALTKCEDGRETVAVFDPIHARVVRQLFRLPANERTDSLTFAAGGSAAYVVTEYPAFTGIGESAELRVYAWHGDGDLTRVDVAEPVQAVAW